MKRMVRIGLLLALVGGAVALLPKPGPGAESPPQYKVTALPFPAEFTTSLVLGMTENGIGYGLCRRANGEQTATYWTPDGRFKLLPVSDGVKFSRVLGANLWGDMVGDQWIEPNGNRRATVWIEDQPYALGKTGEHSIASAINFAGKVVGARGLAANSIIACEFLPDGTVVDIPSFPGTVFSQATQINDRGDVAGDALTADRMHIYPFVRTAEGKVTNLSALPGYAHGRAQDINEAGDVVGMSLANPSAPNPSRAFYYSASLNRIYFLPTPDGYNSWALGMNDQGDVAGFVFPNPAQGATPIGIATLWLRNSPTAGPRVAQNGPTWTVLYNASTGEWTEVDLNGSAVGNQRRADGSFAPVEGEPDGYRRHCQIHYLPNDTVPSDERTGVYCEGEGCTLWERPGVAPGRPSSDRTYNAIGKHGKDNPLMAPQYDTRNHYVCREGPA